MLCYGREALVISISARTARNPLAQSLTIAVRSA